MSPRKRIEPGTQAAFGDLAPRPRRRPGLAVLVAAATVLVIAAVAVSAAVLVTHQRHYDAAVRDVAVIGFVRTFMTHYTSPDPFHANDYADAVLAQSTGQLADMYKKRMNEIVVQVARAEPTQGAVLDAGIERWNDDGSANVVVAAADDDHAAGRQEDRERKPLVGNGSPGRGPVEDQQPAAGDLTADPAADPGGVIGCRSARPSACR